MERGAVFFFLFSVIMVVTTAATFATYRQYKCVLVQKRIPLSFMIYYNAAIIYSLKTLKNYLEDTIICILQKSSCIYKWKCRKKVAFFMRFTRGCNFFINTILTLVKLL